MKRVGIICECNPFHDGHAYLIQRARAAGADAVIAVMSGCFVQRGEAAVADPYLRAEALLAGGADAVLELPFPYAASGAEFFARAGVDILEKLGVDELWFGSECGDLSALSQLAALAGSEDFVARYEAAAKEKGGTAEAYFALLQELAGEAIPCSPNDILAISYLRAMQELGAGMRPVTVTRRGSGYVDDRLTPGQFPSASALRRKWREEGVASVLPHLPAATAHLYASVQAPADLRYAERLILGWLRLTSAEELEEIAELSGGLGNRLAEAAMQADSLEALLSLAATKKYPLARLRRGILFALTNVAREDLRTSPAYVRLLAANGAGRAFLAECRKRATIPVVTRKTDLPSTPAAMRQAEWERRAWALYALSQAEIGSGTTLWKQVPRMKNE